MRPDCVDAPAKLERLTVDFSFDLAVIGGGIVGLSVALEAVQRFPGLRVGLVEKESGVARTRQDTIAE